MSPNEILAFIQKIEGLENIPEPQLEWLISKSEIKHFEPGDFLFRKSWNADFLYIVLSGRFRVYLDSDSGERNLNEINAGTVTGVLPYSRMKVATGFAEAREAGEVLGLHRDHFREMIVNHAELTTAFVHMMTSRVREFTTQRQQNEKMMALGKLSAGLAHELNNPSAAVIRGAQEMKKLLKNGPEGFKGLMSLDFLPSEIDQVVHLMTEKLEQSIPQLKLIERNALEDDISDWMDDHGVPDSFDMAPNFVDAGYTLADLDHLAGFLPEDKLHVVLAWLSNNLVIERLVDEMESASKRISDLVGSIKSYSHMDRSQERQKADVHTGLKNTLTMLNHKVKKAGMTLELDFDEDLPEVNIFVSELNQVWTNLIDNALDALEGVEQPKLSIHTRRDMEFIRISIEDNGPGIPEAIQSQIFDPFFTTKDVGKGTGLGLEIVRRIVKQHNGKLTVKSIPGQTIFEVCLPIE